MDHEGVDANALLYGGARADREGAELIHWSATAFPYPEIASVEVIDGRPGAAAQVVLEPEGAFAAPARSTASLTPTFQEVPAAGHASTQLVPARLVCLVGLCVTLA